MATQLQFLLFLVLHAALGSPFSWHQSNPSGAPSPRWGANCAMARSNLVMFGGAVNNSFTNEVFELDSASDTWSRLRDNSTSPEVPAPRWGFNWVPVQDATLLLHGGLGGFGYDPTAHKYNDVWSFDPEQNTWTKLWADGASGLAPPSEVWYELGGVPYPGGMAVVQAVGGNVWTFSVKDRQWAQLFDGGAAPNAGKPGNTVCVRNCSVIITVDSYMNVWSFDLKARAWQLSVSNGTAPRPSVRYQYLLATTAADHVVLFGGSHSPKAGDQENDLWSLELNANGGSWTLSIPGNTPGSPSRREHTCWPLGEAVQGRTLFGGTGDMVLGDTWTLRDAMFDRASGVQVTND